MKHKNISIIVAISENFGIGKNNKLLFHLPNDLKRFKTLTLNKTVIMGRNTLLSLPNSKPLKNRRNIVISDIINETFRGCEVVNTIEQAIELIKNEEEVFVIGGGMIYKEFYPLAGKLYLTLVHKSFEADVFFPEINFNEWEETFREVHYDEENDFVYSYIDLISK